MTTRTSPWPAGVPCWTDLAVPDVPRAQEFYAAVLGWTYQGGQEEYGGYLVAQARGHAAAGIGPRPPRTAPAPAAWTLYLAGPDADATAVAVTEHGGTVLLPPGDVGPMGRMLLAADPTGAVFGVWQAGMHIGAGITNEPGALVWEDLRATDPERARAFYRAVFGYTTTPLPGGGADYHTFAPAEGGPPLGGIGGPAEPDARSGWLVYFGVDDVTAAQDAALAHGGTVTVPRFTTPYGPMAALTDPFGADFMVAEPAGNPQPDRGD